MSDRDYKEPTYPLKLAGGFGWNLTSDNSLSPWLQEFSRILGLTAGKRDPHKPDWNFCFDDGSIEYNSETCFHFTLWNVSVIFNTQTAEINCIFHDYRIFEPKKVLYLRMAFALQGLFAGMVKAGGMPVHAALIRKEDIGVLICAPSGKGKSTSANRVSFPWIAECDDTALLVPAENGGYCAHPMPTWSSYLVGNTISRIWDVKSGVPIRMICFLKQSQIEGMTRLKQYDSASRLFYSSMEILRFGLGNSQNEEHQRSLSNSALLNACTVSRQIPAFVMETSLTSPFWECIEYKLEELE